LVGAPEVKVTDQEYPSAYVFDKSARDSRLPRQYLPTVHLKLSWLRCLRASAVAEVAESCGMDALELRNKL
jgi:hypothetical protein